MVGNAEIRTKPVRNTPTSEPNVPTAESRPTTRPVWWMSSSCSVTTIGDTALSTTDGRKKAVVASTTMPTGPSPRSASPNRRMIGTAATDSAPPSTMVGGNSDARVEPVGQAAALPCAYGDAGQHDADDAREGLQGDADVRRQQPPRQRFEHQHHGR